MTPLNWFVLAWFFVGLLSAIFLYSVYKEAEEEQGDFSRFLLSIPTHLYSTTIVLSYVAIFVSGPLFWLWVAYRLLTDKD